jgi:hypothetical protein
MYVTRNRQGQSGASFTAMPVQQRGSKRRNSRSEVAANATQTPWTASFIRVSLAVNLAVLLAVVPALALLSGADFVAAAWGPPTAARGILLSVYAAILVSSALLLWLYERRADKAAAEHMVAALLGVQVLYKVTTPFTAGASNPVALCNLAVAAVHAVTLSLLWWQHQ